MASAWPLKHSVTRACVGAHTGTQTQKKQIYK